jgi:uncharacterized protein (DUF1800 family)
MPHRTVPPNGTDDDGLRYTRPHPTSGGGYRDRPATPGWGAASAPRPAAEPRYGEPYGDHVPYAHRAGHVDSRRFTEGYAEPAHYGPYGDGQARAGYTAPAPQRRGGQWVGPQGGAGYGSTAGLPDIDDDEPDVFRRRALIALGGTAAVVAGAGAMALTPQGRGLIDDLFGDGVDATADQLNAAISDSPAGQQPSTVRTYTDQDESYMGSRAGNQLRRNAPTNGRAYSSPAAAAAATTVTVKTVLAKDPVRHLAQRVTFGATPAVIADIKRQGIDRWIRTQLEPEKIAPTAAETKLGELVTLGMTIKQLREQREALGEKGVNAEQETIDATIARQIWTDRQFFEVMVDFWNDFLHVAAFFDGGEMTRASFDRDVIRKYALGNYADMLVAANRHPALLRYLNQNESSKDSVNENLARENLELYSVGVDGGYTERDVKQAALLQTGRMVRDDEYVYEPARHYVGPVRIMGFRATNDSAEGGEAVADKYFRYLALHPSTARYIARSLATRFVSDTPPKSIVDRLAKTYTASKGQIRPVLMTLLSSGEFWASVGQKVRRPMEYLVATYRTLGVSPNPSPGYEQGNPNRTPFMEGLRQIRDKMEELGQFPTGQPTPDGYPDQFLAWTSAGTMINGWNEATRLVNGDRKMFSYAAPDRLVGARPPATAGAYVDALAKRLVAQKLSTRERNLILGVAGMSASTKVDASMNGAVAAVARALLATPQHHLR